MADRPVCVSSLTFRCQPNMAHGLLQRMDNDLQRLQETATGEIQEATSKIALENLRVKFLGKAGAISRLSENMRNLPKEDRPRVGQAPQRDPEHCHGCAREPVGGDRVGGNCSQSERNRCHASRKGISLWRPASIDAAAGSSGAHFTAFGVCAR